MSEGAVAVFTEYFGNPHNLYGILLVMVLFSIGITIMICLIKANKDRRENRDFDDSDVFVVTLRGLAILLFFAALFAI